jgi:hypothetical protein
MSGLCVHARVPPVENHHPLRENHHESRISGNPQVTATSHILLIINNLYNNSERDDILATAMHCLYSNTADEKQGLEGRRKMTRYSKYLAFAILALAVFVPAASARPGFVFRGYFGGPFYGPAYYGWYGPAYFAPYGVVSGPYEGKVKIDTR